MALIEAMAMGPADRKPTIGELVNEADVSRSLAPFVAGGVEGLALFRDDGPVFAVTSRPGGALTRWETLPPEALATLRRGGERSFGLDGLRFDVRPLFAGAERVAVLVLARRTDAGGAIEARLGEAVAGVLGQMLQTAFAAWVTSQMHLAVSAESHHELTHRNAELQRAVEHLQQLDKLKSNFLATVSHELRTPLTSVIGFSEMLLESLAGPLSDEQREYVQTILDRGEELLSLITHLLEMSQLEGGTVRLLLRPHAVDSLLSRAMEAVRLSAEQGGVTLLEPLATGLSVIVDAEKIQRVVVNLLANAIKFTPAGGQVTIEACMAPIRRPFQEETLFGEEDPDAVRITVRDNGIGMAREQLGRVFEAFYQVDSSPTRAHGGAGLGLSIVRNLVIAHGGEVWAESESGQGTAVSFTVPVASAAAESDD